MSDTTFTPDLLRVIHPLDDVLEQKLYHADLGSMQDDCGGAILAGVAALLPGRDGLAGGLAGAIGNVTIAAAEPGPS